MTRLHDRIALDGSTRVRLPNGMLRVDATFARTGVQTYLASELGVKDRPANAVIRVYRPPEEVFRQDSMASFANKPVTNDHPPVSVTADNFAQYSRGWSSEQVAQDDKLMKGSLFIGDVKLISAVEDGKVEISNGYDCDLEWTAGTSPDGETYDAIQRNIVGNHIAVVAAGRCGDACRIHDGKNMTDCGCGGKDQKEPKVADLKKVTVDGLTVEANDAAASAIEKLMGERDAARREKGEAEAKLATDKAAWDAEKGKLEAEAATAKAAIPTGDALDKLVTARTALIADAKALVPALDATGKTDDAIRAEVVTARLGAETVAGKDAAFFNPAFDALVIQHKANGGGQGQGGSDPVRDSLVQGGGAQGGGGQSQGAQAMSDAYADYSNHLSTAWQGGEPATKQ